MSQAGGLCSCRRDSAGLEIDGAGGVFAYVLLGEGAFVDFGSVDRCSGCGGASEVLDFAGNVDAGTGGGRCGERCDACACHVDVGSRCAIQLGGGSGKVGDVDIGAGCAVGGDGLAVDRGDVDVGPGCAVQGDSVGGVGADNVEVGA